MHQNVFRGSTDHKQRVNKKQDSPVPSGGQGKHTLTLASN